MTGCRFIECDPLEIRTRGSEIYCNKPVVPGSSWCEEHRDRIYVKVGAPPRRAVEEQPAA